MKLIKILLVSLVVLALAGGTALAADPKPQTFCPVLGGNVDKKVYRRLQRERIYFLLPRAVMRSSKRTRKKHDEENGSRGDHPGESAPKGK